MKRRTFLQGMAAVAATWTAHEAMAQTPSPETVQNVRNQLLDSFAKRIELEQVSPENIEWIDGISDGNCCTFE